MFQLASRALYLILLLGVSWWVMTFTHETGHIIGGWLSGGTLKSANLLPWHLPCGIPAPVRERVDEPSPQCFAFFQEFVEKHAVQR